MAGRDARELYVAIVGDDRQLSKAFKNSTAEAQKFDRNMNKAARGVAAGSGAFKALGRSLAFASGGFLAGASVSNLLRQSIEQAQEAAVVQRQLAAQFEASGQNLGRYQQQIDTTVQSLSRLAGIEDDELKAAFTSAFRGTNNVSSALKILTAATDVARGRNVSAAQATLALTKAFGGQSSALRRLGIQVPATLRGLDAIRFVQEKFAGQAEAGASSQDRFSAALANFEEVLGTKLLPTLSTTLDTMTEWLQNQENQKNAVHGVSVSMKIFGGLMKGVDFLLGESRREWDLFGKSIDKVTETFRELGLIAPKVAGMVGPVGTPTAAFPGGRAPGTRGPVGQRLPAGTSFQGQMNQLEMRLAQALTTVSRADDRAILVLQRHLLERWLAHTKDWKLRRQLYQQLGSVQGQITSINEDMAQAAQDAAQREKDAKQKERDAEQKRLETHREHIRKMRAAWQEQLQKIREATDAVRNEFGALPFQPTPAGILGVRGQTAGGFASAYVAQTRTFVRFYNSLSRLSRMGAPAGLVGELRGLGVEGAGLVGQLATHPRQLRNLIRSFRERDRVIQQIAHADIQARNVTIHMAGSRTGATSAASRRGRQAGVAT